MSEPGGALASEGAQARRRPYFRRSYDLPRLTPEAQARQGVISSEAFMALGRDEALRFLNTHHDALGGRPLALATASEEGLAAVMCAIKVWSRPRVEANP